MNDIVLSGLRAQQSRMETVFKNVAGSSDPNYTRKSRPVVTEANGHGVRVQAEQRTVDVMRVEDVRRKTTDTGYLSVLNSSHEDLQREFGSPGDQSSLGAELTKLKNQLSRVGDSPDMHGYREESLRGLTKMAASIKSLGNKFQQERYDSENAIKDHACHVIFNGIF